MSVITAPTYTGPSFVGQLNPESKVPMDLSDSDGDGRRAPGAPSVRRAEARDVEASVALLVASITTLCAKDHLNDPATLERWLANKTAAHFERWLADPENFIAVAELGGSVCGVAALHSSGAVRLFYTLPGVQRHGVGRALMRGLEAEARRLGLSQLTLMSTGNARPFYEAAGFVASGDATTAFGVLKQYPYTKSP